MTKNIFISVLLLFLLSSAMSETIVLVLRDHNKEVNLDFDNEKNEERNEKEIEELSKLTHQNDINFLELIIASSQKPIEFINLDYTNPIHSIFTPPPKVNNYLLKVC